MPMTKERYNTLLQASMRQMNGSKSGCRVVLTPHFEKNSNMSATELAKVDKDNEPIEFDTIDSVNVNSSSTVTTYPLVNGDTVADHIIKQPTTVSISGTYSMYGNRPTLFSGEDDRLTNIEKFFERLKDEGVMCSIVTKDRGSDSRQRFKARDNMVLTSISWTESQASLSFSFTFTEVLTVELNDIQIDYTDENLPAITDASMLDFTDTFIDYNQVIQICIQQLDSLGLMQKEFWPNIVYWLKTVKDARVATFVGGTTAGLAAGITALITIAAIVHTIPVAGWITGAVIAGVGMIVGAVAALVSTLKKKKAERDYAIEEFKVYKDENKQKQENIRFTNYIGNISTQLDYLEDVIQVYGISSNTEQECMMYIDNDYYVFTFKKNNTKTEKDRVVWNCAVTNSSNSDEIVKDISDVANTALSSISSCNSTNSIFRTDNGYYVYLMNKDLFTKENAEYSSNAEKSKAINECKNNLTHFCVLISTINMDNFNETLKNVVINAMKR